MRKIVISLILCAIICSCAALKYPGCEVNYIYDEGERTRIALREKPELQKYYNNGLLSVGTVAVIVDPEGKVRYDFDWRYVTVVHTDYSTMMKLLKENFPELYDLYRNGSIIVNSVSEYVDQDGDIRLNVSYRYR